MESLFHLLLVRRIDWSIFRYCRCDKTLYSWHFCTHHRRSEELDNDCGATKGSQHDTGHSPSVRSILLHRRHQLSILDSFRLLRTHSGLEDWQRENITAGSRSIGG